MPKSAENIFNDWFLRETLLSDPVFFTREISPEYRYLAAAAILPEAFKYTLLPPLDHENACFDVSRT